MVKSTGISLIYGPKQTIIRVGVILTILWIAIKCTRNPVKAFKLLRSLINERLNIHENSGEFKSVRSAGKYYWSVNFPGWPSESFNNFILNEMNRILIPHESHLQTIILSITNICNLNCTHCYESENISHNNKLSLAELKTVISKIREAGINHIHLSGGEPLCRFGDMLELMKHSGNNCEYWINTSGFGLTKEKAIKMKEYGMTGAVISLDHWNEDSHNAFRKNEKSFYWVTEAARNCNETGILVCLSLCPMREFVSEENLNIYHNLAKELGAGFIRIFEPRKSGRFAGEDILLSDEQLSVIDRFMLTRNSDSKYLNFPIVQFTGHHQRKSGCLGAGNRYIFIDSNGEYHSCPFCRKSLGNALTESINTGISRARASGCHVFKQITLI